jgi:hypothetical protein
MGRRVGVGIGLGLVVVVAILVVLPLGAVWASHHWRDPPPEKWGIPPEQLAAARNSPELVRHRRRIELGVTHGPRATAVERAISKGIAAPPELRAATHELAGIRIQELDAQLPRSRVVFGCWIALVAVMVAVAIVSHVWVGLFWAVIWGARGLVTGPYVVRWQRRRAEAAVAANAG